MLARSDTDSPCAPQLSQAFAVSRTSLSDGHITDAKSNASTTLLSSTEKLSITVPRTMSYTVGRADYELTEKYHVFTNSGGTQFPKKKKKRLSLFQLFMDRCGSWRCGESQQCALHVESSSTQTWRAPSTFILTVYHTVNTAAGSSSPWATPL